MLRQIALVSYGTRFLRGEIALDDWYRHGIFFDARLQFRSLADNTLLADDFTLWLGMLKATGAVRLTLHLASGLDIAPPGVMLRGDCAVVVHYADRHDVWAVGEESSSWLQHPAYPHDAQHFPVFPDAAYYGGEIDSYWCVEQRPGTLDVPNTDWKALAAAIAADLDITMPSSLVPAGPYVRPIPEPAPWARFPLFPSSPDCASTMLAHRMIATLDHERAKFANDTHPKNDSSPYQFLDQAGAARMDAWGARLHGWITEVQLRCANEVHGGKVDTTDAPRLHTPEPARRVEQEQDGTGADGTLAAPARAPDGKVADSKWLRRTGLALAVAVLSLFVLALANIIAAFPWLAVLIGLPWALYHKFKREDEKAGSA